MNGMSKENCQVSLMKWWSAQEETHDQICDNDAEEILGSRDGEVCGVPYGWAGPRRLADDGAMIRGVNDDGKGAYDSFLVQIEPITEDSTVFLTISTNGTRAT